jgi:hypothetical protein
MRHEVRYALEHAPGFEDEGREGDFVEVHADSGGRFISRRIGRGQTHVGAHRSCEMSDRMIEPSSSSLWGVIVSTVVDIVRGEGWG